MKLERLKFFGDRPKGGDVLSGLSLEILHRSRLILEDPKNFQMLGLKGRRLSPKTAHGLREFGVLHHEELNESTNDTTSGDYSGSRSDKHSSNTIGPADVGLKEENPDEDRGHGFFGLDQLNRVARWSQPITFLDIFDSDSFTMCVFCFPTSSVIPLHDHPGMTVFSKILYGSLHVKAYDWVEPALIRESKGPVYFPVRLAKLVKDEVLTAPCEASVLYPKSYGNLHCFTAVTPCAVLDVLTPPYRENAGRRCTYYHDYPYAAFSSVNGDVVKDGREEDYAWLAEVKTPDNLYMRQGRYVGPTIQV